MTTFPYSTYVSLWLTRPGAEWHEIIRPASRTFGAESPSG
jgi:hypothetical protein